MTELRVYTQRKEIKSFLNIPLRASRPNPAPEAGILQPGFIGERRPEQRPLSERP
jgi:hypothetical protein